MKQIFSLLLYLNGLVPVTVIILQTIPHNYDVIMENVSQSDAQMHCREMDTVLAIILSDTDWVKLKKETENKDLTSPAWVGLYDDVDSWRWSLNELPLTSDIYIKWKPGQPDNNRGEQACGLMNVNWFDDTCTEKKPFICYNGSLSGADRFIGINTSHLSWPEAQAYCREHHTDLASSLSITDDDILTSITKKQGQSWFGLYRDTWKWSDGTSAVNLTWASGQPDNSAKNENCAVVHNGLFSDEPCNNLHSFICHSISSKRSQIMRMEVKSDGTVLDHALLSSIFEQIKEKLEEKHVFNITVTWRLKPDGKIFHKKKKTEL